MGYIRGLHSSPGVYVKLTDVGGYRLNNQRIRKQNGSGGKQPSPPVVTSWVFGDKLPIIFS